MGYWEWDTTIFQQPEIRLVICFSLLNDWKIATCKKRSCSISQMRVDNCFFTPLFRFFRFFSLAQLLLWFPYFLLLFCSVIKKRLNQLNTFIIWNKSWAFSTSVPRSGGIIPLSSIFFQEEELLLHHPFQFGVELNLLFPSNFPGELTARSREKEEEVKLSQFYFYL